MIFDWMPVIFTFMLASFPAGLVIYWAWNNMLSVLQQCFIMKQATASRSSCGTTCKALFGKKTPPEPAQAPAQTEPADDQGPGGMPASASRCTAADRDRGRPPAVRRRTGDFIAAAPARSTRCRRCAASRSPSPGRSNVGKSSLINALTGRKALARTSHTPGPHAGADLLRRRPADADPGRHAGLRLRGRAEGQGEGLDRADPRLPARPRQPRPRLSC